MRVPRDDYLATNVGYIASAQLPQVAQEVI